MLHKNAIFKYAEKLGVGGLHFKIDPETGLFAVIALHSTKRGPAIGGCRWISYRSTNEAVYDALKLAVSMSFKAAVSNLAHGGGKAVLIRPENIAGLDQEKYFAAFASLLNQLNGSYVTAADSGTSPAEMDIIARYTPHVTSTSRIGNPAAFTARGVLRGIEAAVKFKLKKDSLAGLHITFQGIGQVGYFLAKECYERGAKLTVADAQIARAQICAKEFHAEIASPERIHTIPSDVFAPCALGNVFNHQTIAELGATIVAGPANNQLSCKSDGHLLHQRNILYAPDFVINGGGLIHASGKYYHASDAQIEKKIDNIYDTLMIIFDSAYAQCKPANDIADELALEMLERTPNLWH